VQQQLGELLGGVGEGEALARPVVEFVGDGVEVGLAAVDDVLFLHLRERSTEFATLTATGWDDHALGRLLTFEGLWIGAVGAITGAVIGLAAAALFAGAVPVTLLLTTVSAAIAGIALLA
jgi:putative ABC transport system permease protein